MAFLKLIPFHVQILVTKMIFSVMLSFPFKTWYPLPLHVQSHVHESVQSCIYALDIRDQLIGTLSHAVMHQLSHKIMY